MSKADDDPPPADDDSAAKATLPPPDPFRDMRKLFQKLNWKWLDEMTQALALDDDDDFNEFLFLSDKAFDNELRTYKPTSKRAKYHISKLRQYALYHRENPVWMTTITRHDFLIFGHENVATADSASSKSSKTTKTKHRSVKKPPTKPKNSKHSSSSSSSSSNTTLTAASKKSQKSKARNSVTHVPNPQSSPAPVPAGTSSKPLTATSATSTPQLDFIAGSGMLRADATNNPALRRNMRYSLPSPAIAPTYGDLQHWNKLKVPLATSEPATIFRWYTQLQAEAARVDINLCPLPLFNEEFSIIPGDITAPAAYDANDKLIQKFRSVDGLSTTDKKVQLYMATCIGVLPHRLSAYLFLHMLVASAFAEVKRQVSTPPTYKNAGSAMEYATKLLDYQNMEHIVFKRNISDTEITRRFLTELQAHDFTVDHHMTALDNVPTHQVLPSHLRVTALAVQIPEKPFTAVGHRMNTRPNNRNHHHNDNNGRTQHRTQGQDTDRNRKSTHPFYQPVKDAYCDACKRPNHVPHTCLPLARFLALQKYAHDHADECTKILAKFNKHYAQENTKMVARMLQHTAHADDDQDVPNFEQIMDYLDQDFLFAGQD
jgi:hypothetical protein